MRSQPGTAQPAGRRVGNGGSWGDAAICCSLRPCARNRVKQCQHSPPVLPCMVVEQPPTRHSGRPSNGCAAGSDSTRITGSQPASMRNPRSSRPARRAAGPSNPTPASTWSKTTAAAAADRVVAAEAAPLTGAPCPARAGWAPGPPRPAAAPGPDADTPERRTPRRDRAGRRPRQDRSRHQRRCYRRRAAVGADATPLMPAAVLTWSPTCSVTPRCPPLRCICIRTRRGCGPRWTWRPARASRPGCPVSGAASAATTRSAAAAAVVFDHVLAGVGLDGPAARLAGLLERGFLIEAGWDPVMRVLSLPAAHPLLGRPLCRVGGCSTTMHGRTGGLCWHCFTRLRAQGLSEQQIAASPQLPSLPTRRPAGCAVPGCERMSPIPRSTLCVPHQRRLRRTAGVSLEQFLTDPRLRPLPALGPCRVAACSRRAESEHGYCSTHYVRWRTTVTTDPDADQRHWQLTQPAVSQGGQISLRGLAPLVVVEVLFGVQQRVRGGAQIVEVPLRTRCCTPNNTSTTTNGANPRRLTSPPCETAGWVSCQCRWSASGSVVTVVRHRT